MKVNPAPGMNCIGIYLLIYIISCARIIEFLARHNSQAPILSHNGKDLSSWWSFIGPKVKSNSLKSLSHLDWNILTSMLFFPYSSICSHTSPMYNGFFLRRQLWLKCFTPESTKLQAQNEQHHLVFFVKARRNDDFWKFWTHNGNQYSVQQWR
jgi:hypothetical protein